MISAAGYGRPWAFYASYLDPPSRPGNGDGFDDISYDCHVSVMLSLPPAVVHGERPKTVRT